MRANCLFTSVRTLIAADRRPTVRECRHCGTSVPTDEEICPCCGRADVVEFDVE